jgi:hypothetical protein
MSKFSETIQANLESKTDPQLWRLVIAAGFEENITFGISKVNVITEIVLKIK